MRLPHFATGGFCVWAAFGSPANDLAGLFWPERPAPWERIDAFYYPDRRNFSVHRAAHDVGSLGGCRSWVRAMAEANADPGVTHGDYECGVGKLREWGGLTVYRITAR